MGAADRGAAWHVLRSLSLMDVITAPRPVLAAPVRFRTGMARPAGDVPEVIASLIAQVAHPTDLLARIRFAVVADALGELAGAVVAAQIEHPAEPGISAFRRIPVFALVVQAIHLLNRSGRQLSAQVQILRGIREQVRAELAHVPGIGTAQWVVPVDALAITAAHVAALILTRDGIPSRPWLWPGTPSRGGFRTLGYQGPGGRPALAGTLTLAALAGAMPIAA